MNKMIQLSSSKKEINEDMRRLMTHVSVISLFAQGKVPVVNRVVT